MVDVLKDASDEAPLPFARISETDKNDREIISIPGLTKGQVTNSVSGDNSNFRVDWVNLPMDVFNAGIPGAINVNSQDPNGSSYNIFTCTFDARWDSSAIMSSTRLPWEVTSHMTKIPSSWLNEAVFEDIYGYSFSTVPNFSNTSNFSYTQRHQFLQGLDRISQPHCFCPIMLRKNTSP